jgi:hypothetical protein
MSKTITKLAKCMSLFTACFALNSAVQAQTSGGPDTYGYVWRDSNDPAGPAYNWIDLTTAPGAIQVTGLADDNIKGPFAVGFPFHYYWYDVTTFRVGSNGYVGFSNTPVAHPFPVIPTAAGIQNYLAIMASDLTFTDPAGATLPGVECWYWTSPGNDSLVVSYLNVPFWDPLAPGYTGSNTFQVILSNVDSSITYHYQLQSGVYNNPANFCTIGIENNSGNIGLQHSHDVFPPSVYAIKFYYPATTSFSVNDASTVFADNEDSGGLFLAKDGGPFTLTGQVRNTGNQPLASYNVSGRVVNALNVNQVTNTFSTAPSTPGQVEDIIFPNTFNPAVNVGTYRFITETQLAGDATPTNNLKTVELVVVDTNLTNINLSFDNGVDAGLGGLGWQGGGGGAGIEFIPPFYPCNVTQLSAFIAADANAVGFAMMILDDDGPNGTPGTVLDSVYVGPSIVIVGGWNNVTLPTPVLVTSGSFYVAWVMGGDGVSIGQNQIAPISNRTYEILGQASNPNSWAAYRYREIEDVMINAVIQPITIGLNENNFTNQLSNIYPNPATNNIQVNYNFTEATDLSWSILDVTGKNVIAGNTGSSVSSGTLQIDISTVPAGVYVLSMSNGTEFYNKKVTVIR